MNKLFLIASATSLLSIYSCSIQTDRSIKTFDEISKEVKTKFAPDRRDKTYEITYQKEGNNYVLRGVTTEIKAKDTLLAKLAEKGITPIDSIKMLPDSKLDGETYGITAQSVINFRYGPGYSNENATQTIMGTPLRILEKKNGWTRAITPEGYTSWVSSGSIAYMNKEEYKEWIDSDKLIITTHYTLFREANNAKSGVVSDGVWGNIVKKICVKGSYYQVELPNGKQAYLKKSYATDYVKWVNSRKATANNIIATSKEFLGFPYLWGGTSIKAMDCSGFTKTVFYLNGVILARDASQQAKTGTDIEITNGFENLKAGDLLFFGEKAKDDKKERVSHVGIYIGNNIFIHSATSVKINSLNPKDANYYSRSNKLVRVRRLIGNEDKNMGITTIKNHPWY